MNALGIFAVTFTLAVLFLYTPIALIWSLNTLFPLLNISYNFHTWLAALLMLTLLSATRIKFSTDKK